MSIKSIALTDGVVFVGLCGSIYFALVCEPKYRSIETKLRMQQVCEF